MLAKITHLLKLSIFVVIGTSALLLFAESFFYPGFSEKYFHVQPKLIAAWALLWTVILRIVSKNSIKLSQEAFSWLYWYAAPFISILAFCLKVSQDLIYTNFPFQIFHLHTEPTVLLAAYLLGVIVICFQPKVVLRKPKWSYFVTSIILLCNLAYFKWNFESTWWHQLRREDGPFEYMTAFAFLFCSLVAGRFILIMRKLDLSPWKKYLLLVFFTFVSVSCFAVAGEEISWGQRLFNIETPTDWADVNTQREITLHNHKKVLPYIYQAYLLLAAYFCFSWVILKLVNLLLRSVDLAKNPWLKLLIPNWYLFPYFLPTLIYTVGRFTIGWSYYGLGQWEETTEAVLSIGLLFFILDLWRQKNDLIRAFKGM